MRHHFCIQTAVLNFNSYFKNVGRVHTKRQLLVKNVQAQYVYHCSLFLLFLIKLRWPKNKREKGYNYEAGLKRGIQI